MQRLYRVNFSVWKSIRGEAGLQLPFFSAPSVFIFRRMVANAVSIWVAMTLLYQLA